MRRHTVAPEAGSGSDTAEGNVPAGQGSRSKAPVRLGDGDEGQGHARRPDTDGAETAAPAEAPEETALRAAVAAKPRPQRRPARPVTTPGGRRTATRLASPVAPLPKGSGPGARIRPAGAARGTGAIKRGRPRKAVVLLGLVVVLLTTGLGAYGIVSAGFFRVGRVEVVGAWFVDADEIARATGAQQRDLFTVDVDAARRNVERLSGIRAAEVRAVWPRRLVVTVQERAPVAVWHIGAAGYVVDGEGVVLDSVPDPAMLTIFQLDGAPGLLAGDHVDGDAVRLATRLRNAAPAAVNQQIARFEWTQRAGLEAITGQGIRVRLGDSNDLEYKLAVWRGVLEQAKRDKYALSEIDLRFGDRVAYR